VKHLSGQHIAVDSTPALKYLPPACRHVAAARTPPPAWREGLALLAVVRALLLRPAGAPARLRALLHEVAARRGLGVLAYRNYNSLCYGKSLLGLKCMLERSHSDLYGGSACHACCIAGLPPGRSLCPQAPCHRVGTLPACGPPRRHPDSDVRDTAALYADLAVMLPPPRLRATLAGPAPVDAGPADAARGGAAPEPGLGLTLGHAPRVLCPAPAPPAGGAERALLAACAAGPGPAAGSQAVHDLPAARPAAVSVPEDTGGSGNGEREQEAAKAPGVARPGDGAAAAGGGTGVLSEYLAHIAALEAPDIVLWLQLSVSVAAPAPSPAPAGHPKDGPAPPSHTPTRAEDGSQQPSGRAAAASPAGQEAAGAASPATAGGAGVPGPSSREGGADHALYGVEITFTSGAAHGQALVTQGSSDASHSAALEAEREAGGGAAAEAWLDHAGSWACQQARGRWARIGAVRVPRLAAGDAGAPVPISPPCPIEPRHGAMVPMVPGAPVPTLCPAAHAQQPPASTDGSPAVLHGLVALGAAPSQAPLLRSLTPSLPSRRPWRG
jgi:hypothetical protein